MSTYLDLVNEVLQRLRENPVASVQQNKYSKLISLFVNDAKRIVEDAWNWDALSVNTPVITTSGTSNYSVVGSGRRQKDVTVNDTTNRAYICNVPYKWIQDQQQLSTVQSGNPCYYTWNGFDGTDSKVELFPTPDGTYTLMFNMVVPQVNLSADTDVLIVPSEPVIAYAYARALVERGEDGGMQSSEAYNIYETILADYIALESTRFIENECWVAN
jgi:hypothetical protein